MRSEVTSLRAGFSSSRRMAAATASALLTALILLPVQLMVDPPGLLLERFVPGGGWVELMLLSAYAAWLSGKMLDVRLAPLWRRRIWRLFSIVFFLQLTLGLLGLDRFLMTGNLHLPVPALIAAGPLYRGGGLFMPILFGATVLLVGSAWCSHLCYVGAWDDLAATRKRRAAALPRWRLPLQISLLALVVATALVLRWAGVPASVALYPAAGFGVLGLAVMVLASRRTGAMVHCSSFCPMGLLATWFGRLNPFRIAIADGCNECGACSAPCRYDALKAEDIRRRRPGSSCTLCGDCLSRCRDGRLGYRFPGLSPEAARALFVVLVVAGHASFLGVARI